MNSDPYPGVPRPPGFDVPTVKERRVLPNVEECLPTATAALGYCIGRLEELEKTVPTWVTNALWSIGHAAERDRRHDT